jgi:hypothetical protein
MNQIQVLNFGQGKAQTTGSFFMYLFVERPLQTSKALSRWIENQWTHF